MQNGFFLLYRPENATLESSSIKKCGILSLALKSAFFDTTASSLKYIPKHKITSYFSIFLTLCIFLCCAYFHLYLSRCPHFHVYFCTLGTFSSTFFTLSIFLTDIFPIESKKHVHAYAKVSFLPSWTQLKSIYTFAYNSSWIFTLAFNLRSWIKMWTWRSRWFNSTSYC